MTSPNFWMTKAKSNRTASKKLGAVIEKIFVCPFEKKESQGDIGRKHESWHMSSELGAVKYIWEKHVYRVHKFGKNYLTAPTNIGSSHIEI